MRWAKMSKYIADFGWEPVVFTPEGGEIGAHDESLLKALPASLTVIKTPIWEPYDLYKRFTGKKKSEKIYSGFIQENKKTSLAQKISVFIRGNFFIPDARMFWIRPSVKYLKEYLKQNPVDAIVSTGPPHSTHMIALHLHRSTSIPWIADFRDPWTNIDFYHDLKLTKWADRKHHRMEATVLKEATKVVTVTWRMRDEFVDLCGRQDIEVIPNGYDDADFVNNASTRLDEEFTLTHIGSMNKDRNPQVLWTALQQAIKESDELKSKLKIRLIGPVDFSVRQSVRDAGLESFTEFVEFMPHADVVQLQQKAQVNLLIINNSPNARIIIPGKLYEYLGSGRPIIAIGPKDSDFIKVMDMTQGGVVHDYEDVEGLKNRILEFFKLYKAGNLQGTATGTQLFTRKNLAKEFASLLESIDFPEGKK